MEVNQYFYSLAKISSQKAAENGVHVDPKFIYTQWYIDGMTNANSLYNYVAALHHGGYFTADFDTYYSAVLQVFNTINF